MEKEVQPEFIYEFWPHLNETRPDLFVNSDELQSALVWHDRPKAIVYKVCMKVGHKHEVYYLKQYKKHSKSLNALNEYAILKVLYESFEDKSKIGVIEPVAYLDDVNAFVTKEFFGVDLYTEFKIATSYLSSNINMRRAVDITTKMSDWFVCFQSVEPKNDVESRTFDQVLEWTLADIDKSEATGMVSADLSSAIRKKLHSIESDVRSVSARLVPSNEDAKIWNFMVNDRDELRAFDFVGFTFASPAYDIARIWIGLNWIKIFPWVQSAKVTILQNVFLENSTSNIKYSKQELNFYKLSVAVEVTAFYGRIRQDPYRRKLRNVMFFFLIKRYYRNLIKNLLCEN